MKCGWGNIFGREQQAEKDDVIILSSSNINRWKDGSNKKFMVMLSPFNRHFFIIPHISWSWFLIVLEENKVNHLFPTTPPNSISGNLRFDLAVHSAATPRDLDQEWKRGIFSVGFQFSIKWWSGRPLLKNLISPFNFLNAFFRGNPNLPNFGGQKVSCKMWRKLMSNQLIWPIVCLIFQHFFKPLFTELFKNPFFQILKIFPFDV